MATIIEPSNIKDESTAPEMQQAALRAMIESQLIAALPQQLDAKLASEAQMLMNSMVNEILAQCMRDPANSQSIAQSAVSAAAPRLRSSFTNVRERATNARYETVKKKRSMDNARSSVRRDNIQVRQEYQRADAPDPEPLTTQEYGQVNIQIDGLFDESHLPENMQFIEVEGHPYWRVGLSDGRYALVPAEDIQMIYVRFDPERGYLIEQFSKPILLGGGIQSDMQQMRLSDDSIAQVIGEFADAKQLEDKLRRNQEQMHRLIESWQAEQNRSFGGLLNDGQCGFHGFVQPLSYKDIWEIPSNFAPEETPEPEEKELVLL